MYPLVRMGCLNNNNNNLNTAAHQSSTGINNNISISSRNSSRDENPCLRTVASPSESTLRRGDRCNPMMRGSRLLLQPLPVPLWPAQRTN